MYKFSSILYLGSLVGGLIFLLVTMTDGECTLILYWKRALPDTIKGLSLEKIFLGTSPQTPSFLTILLCIYLVFFYSNLLSLYTFLLLLVITLLLCLLCTLYWFSYLQ